MVCWLRWPRRRAAPPRDSLPLCAGAGASAGNGGASGGHRRQAVAGPGRLCLPLGRGRAGPPLAGGLARDPRAGRPRADWPHARGRGPGSGPWTFCLRIDPDGRFPRTEQVIPQTTPRTSRLCLEAEDAAFLCGRLAPTARPDDDHALTLELDRPPAVRARSEREGPATEVVLTRSRIRASRCACRWIAGCLCGPCSLASAEILVPSAESPLACQETQRVFVFMPLSPQSAPAARSQCPARHVDAGSTDRSTPT